MELRAKNNFLASLVQTPVESLLLSPHHVVDGNQKKSPGGDSLT